MAFASQFSYDVYLSFRGVDTRMGFVSHLYHALSQRGIYTFMDDMELKKGDEVTPSILKAIEESRIAIIVFSENYAFSSFCLNDLATILDCFREGKGMRVLPVFYMVDPSYVRHQKGSYAEAFARHEERFKDDMEKLYRWRMALSHAADLAGFHYTESSYESVFIEKIAKEVLRMIGPPLLHVADYPVGLESRVHKVTSLLNAEADDVVHMVGIHGIGGIGKSTIARAVYNVISHQFEGSCFLPNVREKSDKHGLVHLQEMILSNIVGDMDINIPSIEQGMTIMGRRLSRKRVLLVLDNVDGIEQLEALAGRLEWFGSGSRVIITTRDTHLLALHGVDSSYRVEELTDNDARDLLSWKAFKTKEVEPSYREVLNRAVTYCSRLPLALEVLGSHLYGKSLFEWEAALSRNKRITLRHILDILKVSYDSLCEDEKIIFLDIACFFNGQKLADIEYILLALHGFSTEFIISVLIDKSLINIHDGCVMLHDLIQEMGREVVRLESPTVPGRRSRLWFIKDIVQVLENNEGSDAIESIFLDFPKDEGAKGEEVHWNGEAFKKMRNLKILIIRNCHFNTGPTHLPESLRVLKWWKYPSPSLPDDFHPKKLAILELPESCLRISEPSQTATNRLHKDHTILLSSPILSSDLVPPPTPSVEGPWEDIQEETLECLPEDEVHPTTVQNDSPNIKRYEGDDIEQKAVSLSELKYNVCCLSYTDSMLSNKGSSAIKVPQPFRHWSQTIPFDFCQKKLGPISELLQSCLRISKPIQWQKFIHLTVLDFGYCEWITNIPDVSGLPNLEKLSFEQCENLIQIHESVGFLDKLRIVNAICCKKLRTYPPFRMTSLEQFNVSLRKKHKKNKWIFVEISYADHITSHEVPIRVSAKHSGIHIFKQTSGMEDVKFTNSLQAMLKVCLDPNSLERDQRGKITTNRPLKDHTMLPSLPILSTGRAPRPTPLVEVSWEEVQGETSDYLPEEEVHPSTVQNDPLNIERCEGGDIKLEAVPSSELKAETYSYDVFLSFRGDDTRRSFTSHLYNALSQRGIRTFFEMELEKGDKLWQAISKEIEESRIAIILFSQNYAFSSFCLEELATILDRFEEKKVRHVLPVFYDVHPSDVRHLRGSYGEAFTRHEKRFKDDTEKLNRWRKALSHTANSTGFDSRSYSYESEFIATIVKEVSTMINHQLHIPLHVTDCPVGLESRMLKVMQLLKVESDEGVHVVGIYGMGGIGKTTISQAVSNFISDQFEGSCFLEDVRERSARYGLVHLQEIVLSAILGDMNIDLRNVNQGILVIKERLGRKKLFLVLDDVDKIEQLQAVVGGLDWFGSGSKVIITTQDKLLLEHHGVESLYRVEELTEKEARDLFKWHAFKTDKVDPSYTEVLNRAVTYCSRLPLELKVMGSYLFGRSTDQWNDALNRYKRVPHREILEILKISFDSLEKEEQEILLDIACFFNGQKLADIEDILWAHHGFYTKFSISVLIDKSLINIDDGRVILHDTIQDMGREIVRQESPDEPGKRSRLWFVDDVVQVLEQNEGSSKIESISLDFPKGKVHWDGKAFKKMENLKTLIIKNGCFNRGPTHLPQSLRVLRWWGYPSPSLPYDFHPNKLVILELPESCLMISEPIQGFVYLTVLDFGYCEWITRIPDVSGLPNLEKLSFKHCENLIQIHESVGFLDKLRILDAICCKRLRTFPPIRMTRLEQFNISHCSNLEVFPEILGKMENIKELHITGSPIKELPFSIQNLTRLQKLELQFCGMVQIPSSIVVLEELGSMCVSHCEGLQLSKLDKGEKMVSKSSSMECFILSYCNISDDFLPTDLTLFANVKDLNLSGNNFTVLLACFEECHLLRKLNLDDCRFLREIRGIPEKLETLSVKECRSLKFLDLTVLPTCTEGSHFLKELIMDDCVFLQEIGAFPNLDHFSAKNCTSLTSSCISMFQKSTEAGNKMFSLPGSKIPEWFVQCTSGETISFCFRNKVRTISICLDIGSVDEQPTTVKLARVFINDNKQFLVDRIA